MTLRRGSGAETYNLVRSELASIGADDWEARARNIAEETDAIADKAGAEADQAVQAVQRVVYCFGSDAGPDNVGMLNRIRTYFQNVLHMMFVWNFCLFHRVHLISKAQVQLFDKWVWPETYPPESPASTYFNGVSSIANQWRASGSPAKIKQCAAQATVTVTCVVVSTELILIID